MHGCDKESGTLWHAFAHFGSAFRLASRSLPVLLDRALTEALSCVPPHLHPRLHLPTRMRVRRRSRLPSSV